MPTQQEDREAHLMRDLSGDGNDCARFVGQWHRYLSSLSIGDTGSCAVSPAMAQGRARLVRRWHKGVRGLSGNGTSRARFVRRWQWEVRGLSGNGTSCARFVGRWHKGVRVLSGNGISCARFVGRWQWDVRGLSADDSEACAVSPAMAVGRARLVRRWQWDVRG